MKKRIAAKITSLLSLVAIAFGAAGCEKKPHISSVSAAFGSETEIWSTYSTEKILKNVTSDYENVKFAPEINVTAAKGEYEGSQLIISAGKNIKSVTFSVNSLTSGENTFNKTGIEVFYEKYVNVTKIYDIATNAATGWYPDALIPMDAIVKAGENTVKAGENQGIYVRFNVPETQPSGIYRGNFTLTYDGVSKQIPVTLEIKDFVIPAETHSRSLFMSEWQYRLGELDSTQEMLEKYVAAGLEYRISPATVVMERSFDDEGIKYYVEKSVKFMKNPKCTHVSIPFERKTVDGQAAINTDTFRRVLLEYVKASVRDNTDYVKKLGCHLVDEPQQNNWFERTKVMTRLFKETKEKVAKEIAADLTIDEPLRKSLENSIKHLVGSVTGKWEEKYAPHVEVWCPQVDYCDSEEDRALYSSNFERWWYTCISPRAPYPTYHTEDTLLSARAMGWMQAEYDVKGVLFWATNVYAEYDGSKYNNIEDFYEGNASRFSQVNGDGYLFYPGKKYGIDGPIGSLRLEAIRDGLEEYEILYALKEAYKNDGENFNALVKALRQNVYEGTKVATNGKNFKAAREMLYDLPALTDSAAGVRITDIRKTDYNLYETTVKVAGDGYKVYNGQTEITDFVTEGKFRVYSVKTYLDADENSLNLVIAKGSEKHKFNLPFGGKAVRYDPAYLSGAFTKSNAEVISTVIDGNTVGSDGKLLKLDIGEVFEYSRSVKFSADFLNNINSSSKNLTVRFYMRGLTENLPVSVAVYTKNKATGTEIGSSVLKNGDNELELMLAGLGEDNGKKIKYLIFTFGDVGPEEGRISPAITVYVKDFILYSK